MSIDPYSAAKTRVKRKKGFYSHLSVYLAVNIAMFFVVLLSGEGLNWLPIVLMWGIGLACHFFSVFGLPGIGAYDSKEWEREEIRKELVKQGYEVDDESFDEELELRELKKPRREFREDDFV